jgi:hypothetical protein
MNHKNCRMDIVYHTAKIAFSLLMGIFSMLHTETRDMLRVIISICISGCSTKTMFLRWNIFDEIFEGTRSWIKVNWWLWENSLWWLFLNFKISNPDSIKNVILVHKCKFDGRVSHRSIFFFYETFSSMHQLFFVVAMEIFFYRKNFMCGFPADGNAGNKA